VLQRIVDSGPLDLAATLVYSDYQPFSLRVSAQPTGAINDGVGACVDGPLDARAK
jgi:hypothetical protein